MKKRSFLKIIQGPIFIAIIVLIIFLVIWMFKGKREALDENNLKSSMLLIQGACKVLYEDSLMNKAEDKLIGTKLSDVDNNENINKDIINKFKEKNVIPEGDYEKYYVLTDEDLEKLQVYIRNEEESYYIIGYEKDDVIITVGFNEKYRLEDINKEKTEEESKSEDEKTDNVEESEKQGEENNSEEDSENKDEENSDGEENNEPNEESNEG